MTELIISNVALEIGLHFVVFGKFVNKWKMENVNFIRLKINLELFIEL